MVGAMRERYSRSHWDQIVGRVTKAAFKFDVRWKCFLCGNRFTHNSCTHTREENLAVLEEVRPA